MLDPVALSLFGKDIYWYGIIISCAVLLGIYIAMREAKRLGYDSEMIIDFSLLAIPMAIFGARLYYVIFSWEYYAADWRRIFAIWEGGLAVYGSVIGGILAAALFSHWRKIKFWKLTDMIVPSLILGQAMGRWGNFFNQEAYGYEVVNKAWQWFPASVFISVDQKWHLATFFYESIWNFAVFALLMFYRKRKKRDGDIFLLYLLSYSIGRAIIEGLRTDSLMLGPIRVSQLLSILLVVAISVYFIISNRKGSDPALNPETGSARGEKSTAHQGYTSKDRDDK